MDHQHLQQIQQSFDFSTRKLEHFPETFLHFERLQLQDFSNAFSRLILVSFLLVFNLFEIVRSVFFRKQSHCVHSCVYSALLLISNLYLLWWLPYLFTSYRFGTVLPVITSLSTHCGLQHKLSLELSTTILVVLAYRYLFESFSRSRARFLAQAFLIIWIVPQFIYSAILEFSSQTNVLYMVDGLHAPEVPIFSSTGNATIGVGIRGNESSMNAQAHNEFWRDEAGAGTGSGSGNTSGVLLCVHRLTTSVVHGMTWHYIALIVPLTSLLIICIGARRFANGTATLPLTVKDSWTGPFGVQYRTSGESPFLYPFVI